MLDDSGKRLTHRGRVTLAVLLGYSAITIFVSQVQCTPARQGVRTQRPMSYEPVTQDEILQTGGIGEDGGVPRKGIPPEPSPMQQKPPCDPEAEEYEIHGACWQATPRKPPCGDKLREHNGVCYRAIGVRRRGVSEPP